MSHHVTPNSAPSDTEPRVERLRLPAKDGYTLTAYRFDPIMPIKAVIVIASAMAVSQSFYVGFATFLAKQGFQVWTFDYRGIGESLQGSMRDVKTDLMDWVEKDFDSLICIASDAHPHLPLYVIGHSFGGQVAALLPSRKRLTGLISIASGSGATRHNTPQTRRRAPLLWYLLAPLLCSVFGYFPGARIGVIGNLPAGAIFQWRRWCLTSDYILTGQSGAREAYASAQFSILGLAFEDDELLSEQGVRFLHNAYLQSTPDYRVIEAKKFGLKRIGHFGFFKPQAEAQLWPLVANWITR